MALSNRELEDDIIIAIQEVRQNPRCLTTELRNIKENAHAYYTPSTHMATIIGEDDLKDVVSSL
jgi:hypothetical protein